MRNFGALIVTGGFLVLAACSSKIPSLNEKVSSSNTNQADSNIEEKFGLSEVMRKQICRELEQLWLQALSEADKKYPYNATTDLTADGNSRQRIEEQRRKRDELFRSIMDKHVNKLTKKYDLSPEQLADINEEGIEKGWREYPPPRTPIFK